MERVEGLARVSDFNVDYGHPYFLHYRSLNTALARVSSYASGRLLDVGCGNKPYRRMFANISDYVGCDIVQSSEYQVDVICEVTSIPIDSVSFDTVLCTQVMEHVADHQGLLDEIFRVLKNNGVLILSVPMYWPLHEEPFDFFRFTRHGLHHILKRSGLEPVEIMSNGGRMALIGQAMVLAILDNRGVQKRTITTINRLFSRLDDKYFDDRDTMNYVVVARKQ